MVEEWKYIVGFEGLYQISNTGKVKSLPRIRTGKRGWKVIYSKERILKNTKEKYARIMLCKDSIEYKFLVHRLVLEHFNPTNDKSLECNHKDGNKHNNNIDNLEWMTATENMKHGYKNGFFHNIFNEKNHWAKLKNEEVKEIKMLLNSDKSLYEIAEKFNVSYDCIWKIKQNKHWKNIT